MSLIKMQPSAILESKQPWTSLSARPTVTVVVPNFDHARYLPQSLESIAAQTHSPDRVLIIDDASTDNSVNIISRFLSDHPNWRLIRHSARQGVIFGLNEGVLETDTEWITFLGADDVLHPSYLAETLKQAALSPNAGLICSCCEVIGASETRILRPIILPKLTSGMIGPVEFRDMLQTADNYFWGTVTLYRRDAIQFRGGFDPTLGAFTDSFLARQLALQFGFSFIPEVLGYWRIHDQSYSVITSTSTQAIFQKLQRIRAVITADPGLFPDHYDEIFDRRTRFASARLVMMAKLSSREDQVHRVAALLESHTLERLWLTILLSLGRLGHVGALAWLTLRLRPMSIWKLFRQVSIRRAILASSGSYVP
jgi:glycosyltransferase involved in cell wall biosynthesis